MAAKIIVSKDKKFLNEQDYKDIARFAYKTDNKFKIVRLRNMMGTEIAKERLNQELISLYSKANLPKERLPELLKNVEKYANEKKDGNLVLKLVEKIEKINGLSDSRASQPSVQQNNQFNFHDLRDNQGQQRATNDAENIQSESEDVHESEQQ